MRNTDYIELEKRALTCRGWRWMPGMLVSDGVSVAWRVHHDGARLVAVPNVPGWAPMPLDGEEHLDMFPVLTDPATLGCLLALVREAWGDPSLSVLFDHDGCKWRVGRWEDDGLALRCRHADTESEALVAALEAAP